MTQFVDLTHPHLLAEVFNWCCHLGIVQQNLKQPSLIAQSCPILNMQRVNEYTSLVLKLFCKLNRVHYFSKIFSKTRKSQLSRQHKTTENTQTHPQCGSSLHITCVNVYAITQSPVRSQQAHVTRQCNLCGLWLFLCLKQKTSSVGWREKQSSYSCCPSTLSTLQVPPHVVIVSRNLVS